VGNCVTYVINEHIEEQRAQNRSLRDSGKNFKRGGEDTGNTDLRKSA
jgi:hypothetical protein